MRQLRPAVQKNHQKLPVWHAWHKMSVLLCLVSAAVCLKYGDSLQSGYDFCSAKMRSNTYKNSAKLL